MDMVTKTKVEPKVKIKMSAEDLTTVTRGIHAVWQRVGYDVLQGCEDVGERLCNAGALECCIDAGRLADDGGAVGKKAEAILKPLFDTVGWNRVINYLNNHVKLV
jgi:hypothetical protein